ncbi:hypothetical protein H310_08263 [Aphanomyces invadans]|uniref:Uncharacterized protein n=1 Tax=Aphanomyces invadans TaxID=157072 RepID=A0A024U1X0_9STRA|nr:hypothetical protein H310_08263 [Aphanomyces invadans]ETV99612.1 hypothetical protein H310_08263 [Aphanomyces invadans]|eukprot:XP_008872168.1 hypothetical protein H310_08263 [Aphanomyces invadans]
MDATRHLTPQLRRYQERCNLDGAGRPEEIPNTAKLEAFTHKLRDAEKPVTCIYIVHFLKRNQKEWLHNHFTTKTVGISPI